MNTYTIADIHGNYKGLLQCLKRSNFNYDKDKLIVLGDTCDGYYQVKQCITELLKIKNLVYVLGNHDEWARDWFNYIKQYENVEFVPKPDLHWINQGGLNTLISYDINKEMQEPAMCRDYRKIQMTKSHLDLLDESPYFYLDEKNRLFVHAGINPSKQLHEHDIAYLIWDRNLIIYAKEHKQDTPICKYYKEVFVGHSPTMIKSIFGSDARYSPINYSNVWCLDTGAGSEGKLTIMNVDTKEYWQSDFANDLYERRDIV